MWVLGKLLFRSNGAGLVRPLWIGNILQELTWLIPSDFEGRLNVMDCRVERVGRWDYGAVK